MSRRSAYMVSETANVDRAQMASMEGTMNVARETLAARVERAADYSQRMATMMAHPAMDLATRLEMASMLEAQAKALRGLALAMQAQGIGEEAT